MKKIFLLGLITAFWGISVYAEEVKITTYYPSPSGSYKDLQIYNPYVSSDVKNFTESLAHAGLTFLSPTVSLLNQYEYSPGIFWASSADNPDKPKAGIWSGTNTSGQPLSPFSSLFFGASADFSRGLTFPTINNMNHAMEINGYGNVGIGAGADYPTAANQLSSRLLVQSDGTAISALTIQGTSPAISAFSSVGPAIKAQSHPDGAQPTIMVWNNGSSNSIWARSSQAFAPGIVGDSRILGVAGSATDTGSPQNPLPPVDGAVGVKGSSFANSGVGVEGISSLFTGVKGSGAVHDFYADGPGGNFDSASSIRWKQDLTPYEGALDKVIRLNPVNFTWDKNHGSKHDIGLIAEEAGKVVPEVVTYEQNGIDASAIDYGKLTTVLIAAMQEQQKEIEELKQKISKLEQQPED